MNKKSTGSFPSVRNHLTYQRKQSKQFTTFSGTKEQFGHPHTENDKKFETQALSTLQNEVAKKIQSKLRMRKPSGSEKRLSQTLSGNNIDHISSSSSDRHVDIQQQLDSLWENSHEIYELLQKSAVKISSSAMKEQLMKQSSLITCQLGKGQDLETIVVEKLRKKIDKINCIKKCEEKQNNVMMMFDNRLQQLNKILKTR